MFSHSVMYNSLRCHGLQQARRPCPPLFPRVCSKAVYSEYILFSHLHPCYPHPRYYHFLLGLLQQPPNYISSCPLSVYLQHISQRLCKPWLMMILYSHSSTLSHSTESKSHISLKKKTKNLHDPVSWRVAIIFLPSFCSGYSDFCNAQYTKHDSATGYLCLLLLFLQTFRAQICPWIIHSLL